MQRRVQFKSEKWLDSFFKIRIDWFNTERFSSIDDLQMLRLQRPSHDIFQFFIIHLSWSPKRRIQITFVQTHTVNHIATCVYISKTKMIYVNSVLRNTSPGFPFDLIYETPFGWLFFKLSPLKSVNCSIWRASDAIHPLKMLFRSIVLRCNDRTKNDIHSQWQSLMMSSTVQCT